MYQRERSLPIWKRCECGGRINNVIVEKSRTMGHWPMQVKSTGICECGQIHWKTDLTSFAKEEYAAYLRESESSRKQYLKNKRNGKKNE